MKFKRTGPTKVFPGLGLIPHGAIVDLQHTPEGTGWQALDARQRVTEPATPSYTVKELRELLSARGVPVPASARKADLQRLLSEAAG